MTGAPLVAPDPALAARRKSPAAHAGATAGALVVTSRPQTVGSDSISSPSISAGNSNRTSPPCSAVGGLTASATKSPATPVP